MTPKTEDREGGWFWHLSPSFVKAVAIIAAAVISYIAVAGLPIWDREEDQHKAWTVLSGKWQRFGDLHRNIALAGQNKAILLSPIRLNKGAFEAQVLIPEYTESCMAHLALQLPHSPDAYLSAGIGGNGAAYAIGESIRGTWSRLEYLGTATALQYNEDAYRLRLDLQDDALRLFVNDTLVLTHPLTQVLHAATLAFYTAGCNEVNFICPRALR